MDFLVVLSGISTLILSLILGIFVLYIGFKMFSTLSRTINEEEELQKNNIAVAILSGSFIFAMGLMMKSSVISSSNHSVLQFVSFNIFLTVKPFITRN